MPDGTAEKLYTPAILGLAVELGRYPLRDDFMFSGSARSQSCGSSIRLGFDCNGSGAIEAVGMQVSACAIGQASAAIFARHIVGRNAIDVQLSLQEIALWLGGNQSTPAWQDIDMLAPARAYPGRHGAMLLPWKGALEALPNVRAGR